MYRGEFDWIILNQETGMIIHGVMNDRCAYYNWSVDLVEDSFDDETDDFLSGRFHLFAGRVSLFAGRVYLLADRVELVRV